MDSCILFSERFQLFKLLILSEELIVISEVPSFCKFSCKVRIGAILSIWILVWIVFEKFFEFEESVTLPSGIYNSRGPLPYKSVKEISYNFSFEFSEIKENFLNDEDTKSLPTFIFKVFWLKLIDLIFFSISLSWIVIVWLWLA